jgi:hypothetical protein
MTSFIEGFVVGALVMFAFVQWAANYMRIR